MADTQSSQPADTHLFDRLELSLEQWRDHLTRLVPTLPSQEAARLTRIWDNLRQTFEVACLYHNIEIASLSQVLGPLPIGDFSAAELDMTIEALMAARKTLTSMLHETSGRTELLEEVLNTDKPQKMKKGLEKMRAIDEALQARLVGLDSYVEQFQLAELPEHSLSQTTKALIEKTRCIADLTDENARLEQKAREMKVWLDQSKKNLERIPLAPPPSPGAMQQVFLSLSSSETSEDPSLMNLFTSHQKLKEARQYLETFLKDKGTHHA